jgi:bacterioferritin-associated ferredoxin
MCPVCNSEGIKVNNITVKHLVIDELADQVNGKSYFICMNEDCKGIYFSPDLKVLYKSNQVRIPVWFKKDACPKYICYCNQVTEQQIINAVLNDGAKNMKDIIRLTGAMKNGKCEINNPLGGCCSLFIQETINKAVNMKE